jgi:hypothetical protein
MKLRAEDVGACANTERKEVKRHDGLIYSPIYFNLSGFLTSIYGGLYILVI